MTDTLPTERQRFIDATVAKLQRCIERVRSGELTAIAVAYVRHDHGYGGTWDRNGDVPGAGAMVRASLTYLVHETCVCASQAAEDDTTDDPPEVAEANVVRLRPVEGPEP